MTGWKLNRVFAGTAFMPEVKLDFVFKDEITLEGEQSIKVGFSTDPQIPMFDILLNSFLLDQFYEFISSSIFSYF